MNKIEKVMKQAPKARRGETAAFGVAALALVTWMLAAKASRWVAVIFGIMALWNWDPQWAMIAGGAFVFAIASQILFGLWGEDI